MKKIIFKMIPDKMFLKMKYRHRVKRKLDLKSPQTFNAKIQWLKLYDRNPKYTMMVDKYEVKKYIEETIGKQYLIPTIGVYDNFDDIDLEKLPNQFVMKCTHDSGSVVICKNKKEFDFEKAHKKLSKALKRNWFWEGREWAYKNVKPRIIIEKYLEDKNVKELPDYKIMCFNGEPRMSFTCTERFNDGLKVTFFDIDWNKLPFERSHPMSTKEIKKPKNYEKMLELSRILAKNIIFVRVDWYEINGKLYFGELTFYPGNGYEKFQPEEWDYKVGSMLDIPNISKK